MPHMPPQIMAHSHLQATNVRMKKEVMTQGNHFSTSSNLMFLQLVIGLYMLMVGRNRGYNEATALSKGIFSGQQIRRIHLRLDR
jgi:hypothetical protein